MIALFARICGLPSCSRSGNLVKRSACSRIGSIASLHLPIWLRRCRSAVSWRCCYRGRRKRDCCAGCARASTFIRGLPSSEMSMENGLVFRKTRNDGSCPRDDPTPIGAVSLWAPRPPYEGKTFGGYGKKQKWNNESHEFSDGKPFGSLLRLKKLSSFVRFVRFVVRKMPSPFGLVSMVSGFSHTSSTRHFSFYATLARSLPEMLYPALAMKSPFNSIRFVLPSHLLFQV